ncbi:hypothetical protein GJ744_004936 [Endocarpon pusillum]|uniref:Alpha/beta hydrolase fold-3 domain-containing protein n=1 Tax=Endocarpon pusillum TaxID=364733 RepID=A0A8H7A690_9EURO|nr:hypothetical protein GJ744_004936 [Endocarpon pusillum]
MILGPISLIDCAVFVFFLIPQVLYQAGLGLTLVTLIKVLPFLILQLPYQFMQERYLTGRDEQSPFVQRATVFQDIVIRCVRYAFAHMPVKIGRVFFSKQVAYPFFRFRLLRHGHRSEPVSVEEVHQNGIRGLWITGNESAEKPDVVVYYCHGGGFSMGSAYFYLEFLIAWMTRLRERGFKNPAVFALEYTLVPDAVWPQQFVETYAGYKLLIDYMGDASRICVSGDSAGATLILSRLLHHGSYDEEPFVYEARKPALAVLISPWTHLISPLNRNTASDYLDANALELYGAQYLGAESARNALISPGLTEGRWKLASPTKGYCIVYGAEEVFAPAIGETMRHMKNDGARVETRCEPGGIHAWPVVNLFLGSSREDRLKGLDQLTEMVVERMGVGGGVQEQVSEPPKQKKNMTRKDDGGKEAYLSPKTTWPEKWKNSESYAG